MRTRFEAVTLDLDGTLIDDDAATAHATLSMARFLAGTYPAVAEDQLVHLHDEVHARMWADALAAPPPTTPAGWDPAPLVGRIWGATMRAARIEVDHQLPGLVERWLADYTGACRAYPEAPDVVVGLARQGYRLGIITNGAPRVQWPKVRQGGFEHAVGSVSVAGEAGLGKPHPRIFMSTLDALGVRPELAVHVGDSLAADIAGARAVGMKAVWINRKGAVPEAGAPDADAVITSMAELPRALAYL
jgi:putative hydrolase of the HAD superfamily